MKILNTSEVASLSFKVRVGTRTASACVTELREALDWLVVGEAVHVEKSEWTLKSSPAYMNSQWFKNKVFSCRTLADESGWVIHRAR